MATAPYSEDNVSSGTGNTGKGGREKWKSKAEFLLAHLGASIGYGNLWRFPFLCYKNGGSVFLVSYVLALLLVAFPTYSMEMFLGQYFSSGPVVVFARIKKHFKGIGYSMTILIIIWSCYFNILLAWSIFYLVVSFASPLPWSTCDNDFNSPNCFNKIESETCESAGLLYFNKSCTGKADYCALAGMEFLNSSYCGLLGNSSLLETKHIQSSIKRISSSEDFFRNRMLAVTGKTWEDLGNVRWELVGCLALSWILTGACMIRGIKSVGKVAYVTATAPIIVFFVFIVKSATLDGAYEGLQFYLLKINTSKLLEFEVWYDGVTQLIYSLSLGGGAIIAMSSYSSFYSNCIRDGAIICFGCSFTSIYAGFAVFMVLGFMANELEVPISEVVTAGSGLAFITYPEAISKMAFPNVWAVVFFLMLVTLGIDTQLLYVETISTIIFDAYPSLRPKKPLIVATMCSVLCLLGIPLCLEGGIFLLDFIVDSTVGISVFFLVFCEVFVVQISYGIRRVIKNLRMDMGLSVSKGIYWYLLITWMFFVPLITVGTGTASIYYYQPSRSGDYIFPYHIQALRWCISATIVISIPLGVLHEMVFGGKKKPDVLEASDNGSRYTSQNADNVRNSMTSF